MFRQLASALSGTGIATEASANQVLTEFRPSQLAEFLEATWQRRSLVTDMAGSSQAFIDADHLTMSRSNFYDLVPPPAIPNPNTVMLPHLVYAYMVESTRIADILRQVLLQFINGGRLPLLSQASQRWVRATEELFFSHAAAYSIRSVTSILRPDSGSVRRNAYMRLLGMDLSHGTEDGRPYPYPRPDSANREFAATFENLLVEVWRAYSNRNNSTGPDATDDTGIEELLRRLREMLTAQRFDGMLSREEFDAVAMMSWCHLTVEHNTVLVSDFRAQSSSAAERLAKIALQVATPAHSRSDAFFQIADLVSIILRGIENGVISGIPGAQSLYMNGGANQAFVLPIIVHWSTLTGRNVKDPSVRALPTATQLIARDGRVARIALPA